MMSSTAIEPYPPALDTSATASTIRSRWLRTTKLRGSPWRPEGSWCGSRDTGSARLRRGPGPRPRGREHAVQDVPDQPRQVRGAPADDVGVDDVVDAADDDVEVDLRHHLAPRRVAVAA